MCMYIMKVECRKCMYMCVCMSLVQPLVQPQDRPQIAQDRGLENIDFSLKICVIQRGGGAKRGYAKDFVDPRHEQDHFLIQKVDFSLEKCSFGAHRVILHYVLRRELVILAKNVNFQLEICVKACGGRLALQNGRPLSLIC